MFDQRFDQIQAEMTSWAALHLASLFRSAAACLHCKVSLRRVQVSSVSAGPTRNTRYVARDRLAWGSPLPALEVLARAASVAITGQ